MNLTHSNDLQFKLYIFYSSLYFFFLSVASLLLINIVRLGLENYYSLNLFILFYVSSIFFSLFFFLNKEKISNKKKYFVKTSLLVLLIFLSPLISLYSKFLFYFILSIISIYGILNFKFFIKKINIKLFLSIAFIASFSVVCLIPWKIGYYFSPELTLFGLTDNQTLQGAAITNIFKNFGKISMGIDGVESGIYKYHYGLYIWWASICKLTDQLALQVLSFTQLTILMPLLFISSFIACSSLIHVNKYYDIKFFFIFILISVLFDSLSGKIYYDSETYTSSLIFLILLIPLFNQLISKKFNYILCIILIFFIPIISSLKLTTGFLYCIIISLVIFYKSQRFNYTIISGVILISLGIFSYINFMPSSYTQMTFWMAFASYVQLITYSTLFSFLPVALILLGIILKFNKFENSLVVSARKFTISFKIFYRWLKFKKISYAKIVTVSSIISLIPIFLFPVGSTSIYNIAHLYWIALPILFINILNLIHIKKSNYIISVITIILFLNLAFKLINVDHLTLSSFFNYLSLNKETPVKYKTTIFENIKNNKTIFNIEQKKIIENLEFNKIVKDIVNKNKEYKSLIVYIPQDNYEFWHIIKKHDKPYWCSSTSFVMQALIGLPTIKGLQDPNLCKSYFVAGPSEYPKTSYLNNLSDKEICNYSKDKNFKYVYRLNSLSNRRKNNLLIC